MMVRFSCFPGHMHSHKQKKTVQSSAEAMQKTLEDGSKSHAMKDFTYLSATSPLRLVERDVLNNYTDHATDSSPLEHGCKSEEFDNISDTEFEVKVHQTAQIRKSQSLGSGLHLKGRVGSCNDSEDESIQIFSCDETHDHRGSLAADAKEFDTSLLDLIQESGPPGSSLLVNSDLANNESIFSVGDQKESEKSSNENSDTQLSNPNESGGHTPCTQFLVRSSSLPNIHSRCWHNTHNFRRSRSTEDFNILDARRKVNLMDEMGNKVMKLKGKTTLKDNEKVTGEKPTDDKFDTCNYVGSAKEWIVPVTDELNMNEHPNGDFSFHQSNELQSKNFRTNRIEEWVTNLQHCGTFEETNAFSISDDDPEIQKGIAVLDNSPVAKLDGKVNPGMETVKKYISSLSANASSAQLVNHGLVVIPFLSAFVSLRALNLSGNTIVRITAGALPRGLHFLNLSRNKISVIEGLRELTRLRVLDLSYNRLVRIGHGLASCSSLKELYLAGNKISEVEGLHRLLKLAVLDLRFNKISTAKCLSQLAANYSSLQAISLEGNPAQKNVGDEQLKKYLQGLLPHLIYFNRQPIKAGGLKDTSDRSARLGIGAHQIDRGLKADLKSTRKGSHGVATHKVSTSSILGRKSQPTNTAKPSMSSRHVGLPPSGTKATTSQRQPIYDSSSKLRIFRSDLSMRRSRSEGTLGAL